MKITKMRRVERKWWAKGSLCGELWGVCPHTNLWVCSSTSDCCFLPLPVVFSFSGYYHQWKCIVHSWLGHCTLFAQIHSMFLAPFITVAKQNKEVPYSASFSFSSGNVLSPQFWDPSKFTNYLFKNPIS